MEKKYNSLKEFYPYYLTQHLNKTCRILHYIGTSLAIMVLLSIPFWGGIQPLLLIPLCGYGFAWVGHAFFEKNKPAAIGNPFWSLASDFIMFKDFLTGKLEAKMEAACKLISEE